jgi:hypothetical protein
MDSRVQLATGLLAALLLSAVAVAQQQPVDRPVLSAKQLEASRRFADTTRSFAPRQSLLVDPSDRSIYIDTGMHFDPREPRTLADQIKEASCSSDAVLSGTVEDQVAFLNEDASFVITEYVIRVDATLRGSLAPATVSNVRPGGSMNVRGRIVTAKHNLYPALVRGQRYVLFLKRLDSGDQFMPTGTTIDTLVGGDKDLRALGPRAEPELARGVESGSVRREIAGVSCGG